MVSSSLGVTSFVFWGCLDKWTLWGLKPTLELAFWGVLNGVKMDFLLLVDDVALTGVEIWLSFWFGVKGKSVCKNGRFDLDLGEIILFILTGVLGLLLNAVVVLDCVVDGFNKTIKACIKLNNKIMGIKLINEITTSNLLNFK